MGGVGGVGGFYYLQHRSELHWCVGRVCCHLVYDQMGGYRTEAVEEHMASMDFLLQVFFSLQPVYINKVLLLLNCLLAL